MAEHEESRQTDEAGAAAAAAAVGEQDDLDALEQRIWKRFQEFDGFESYIATKQAIQMLLNSGLLQAANPKLATSTSIGTPELDSPDPSLSSSSSSFLGRESRVGSISGTSSSNRDLGESPYMVQSPTMMSSAAAAGGMLGQNYSPMSSLSSASTASSSGGGTQYFSNYPSYAASSSNTTLSSSSSIFSPPGMGSGHRSMSSSTSATTSTQRQQSTRRRRRFKILDAGCGKGTVTLLITVMALEGIILPLDEIEITAADLNREMLEDLQRRIHQNGWKHIKVRAFSLEHIPMPENTFHFIFCNIAMHWVQDEDSGLQEAHRVLRPGGKIGLVTFKDLGYLSDTEENPLRLLPNQGWTDPYMIRPKLVKHKFEGMEVFEFEFEHEWKLKTPFQAIEFILQRSIKKLWREENNSEIDEETRCMMAEQVLNEYRKGVYSGSLTSLITLATKP